MFGVWVFADRYWPLLSWGYLHYLWCRSISFVILAILDTYQRRFILFSALEQPLGGNPNSSKLVSSFVTRSLGHDLATAWQSLNVSDHLKAR